MNSIVFFTSLTKFSFNYQKLVNQKLLNILDYPLNQQYKDLIIKYSKEVHLND